MRYQRLSVMAGFCVALVLAGVASAQEGQAMYPRFWPYSVSDYQDQFDYWRVWQARCAVRQVPTSPYNAGARNDAMQNWLTRLRHQQFAVADVVPDERAGALGRALGAGDFATAGLEIDAIYRALEELVAGKEIVRGVGSVQGKVIDQDGVAVEGADVLLYGTPLGSRTDAEGRFAITDVPCTSPRYIVMARKQGHLDGYAGGVAPEPDRPGEALILCETMTPEKAHRTGEFALRVCFLEDIKQVMDPMAPVEAAVLDPGQYPDEVAPYLRSSDTVAFDSLQLRSQAEAILASVPETDRSKSAAVAKAVYSWVVQNIKYDLMSTLPDDPTGGQWQLQLGAWGRGLEDWCRRPAEVMIHMRASAPEFAWLTAALLRALSIPARPAVAGENWVCQWWVQLPSGNGYWANMSTSDGAEEYRRTGDLAARFPAVGDDQIGVYSVDERAPVPIRWQTERPALWLVDPGTYIRTHPSEKGLEIAKKVMSTFPQEGRLPKLETFPLVAPQRSVVSYMLRTTGLVLNVASLGPQTQFTVKFAIPITNQYRETLEISQWTNRPAWIKGVRREREQNDLTREAMEWFCVDVEIGATAPAPPAEEPAAEGQPAEGQPAEQPPAQ